jgi:hypothetical protein
MTRPDRIRLAWLLPLALMLSLWWLFRLNPCVDNDFRTEYRQWFPAPQATAAVPADPDAVVIENPYGIEACDYWPTLTDHWITLLTLLFITALIGFLAARFEQRPIRRAAGVMLGGLAPMVLFSNVVYLPEALRFTETYGYTPALIESGVGIALLALAAGLSSLAAWLRVRHSR